MLKKFRNIVCVIYNFKTLMLQVRVLLTDSVSIVHAPPTGRIFLILHEIMYLFPDKKIKLGL